MTDAQSDPDGMRAIRALRAARLAALEDDARRIAEWYRGVLVQLPAEGEFAPVDGVLVPQARKLRGLQLLVGVHPFASVSGGWIAILSFCASGGSGGSSLSRDQGLNSRDELLAELQDEYWFGSMVELLDRCGEELWRGGGDLSLEERTEAVRAGTHAAAPHGDDCERLAPGALHFGGETEELFDTDGLRITLHQCNECGQRFVREFVKVWGDLWDFWTRVSDEEAELIRQDFGWAAAILLARRRVTLPPQGQAYWDDGVEMVLRMGPRS